MIRAVDSFRLECGMVKLVDFGVTFRNCADWMYSNVSSVLFVFSSALR